MTRTSVVGNIYTLAVIFSVMQVGDSRYIQAKSDVFAVQRERPEFDANELPLEQFPFFRRPIPQLSPRENVRMVKRDVVPFITVGNVKIISASTSAVVHVGSNICIDLESKIKHMRHFLPRPSGAPATLGKVGPGTAAVSSSADYTPQAPQNV